MMDNKTKAMMTVVILGTIIATAIFLMFKPTLTRSEHETSDASSVGKHLVSSTLPSKQVESDVSKGKSVNVTYNDDVVQAEVKSKAKVSDQKADKAGKTDGTLEANLVRRYYRNQGLDSASKSYQRLKNDDGYIVKIVDEDLRQQGGSGTVDILSVDEDGTVSPVNY